MAYGIQNRRQGTFEAESVSFFSTMYLGRDFEGNFESSTAKQAFLQNLLGILNIAWEKLKITNLLIKNTENWENYK
jgi:hypothetical protein